MGDSALIFIHWIIKVTKQSMRYILGTLFFIWKLYIGLVFIITLIIFYPILLPFLYIEKLKPYTYNINVMWSRSIRLLCFYAVETEDSESDIDEPVVLVANHTSYLDIFLLYSILPKKRLLFMGKSEILSYPLIKTFFKKLNIPVERGSSMQSAKAFIKARQEIRKGWSIVLFPEGGIFDNAPKLNPFKNGAFQLAKASKCAIQPVTFQNNYRLFSDPESRLAPAMPGIVRVKIHPIISAEEVDKNDIEATKEKAFQLIASFLPNID